MLPPPRVLGPWLSEAVPDTVMEIVSALPASPWSVTCTVKSTGPVTDSAPDGSTIDELCSLMTAVPFGNDTVWFGAPVTTMGCPLITRFSSVTPPTTTGPAGQLALLQAVRKSDVIPLPETVKLTLACEAIASVSSRPTPTLCRVPVESATAPPVVPLGMSPESSDASTSPPDGGICPVVTLMINPVAGTNTHTPVASPPNVVTACAGLGKITEPSDATSIATSIVRQDHFDLMLSSSASSVKAHIASRACLVGMLTSLPVLTGSVTRSKRPDAA